MDLERIKQNFRLRSGRSKKPAKRPKAQPLPRVEQTAQAATTPSSTTSQTNGHVVTPPNNPSSPRQHSHTTGTDTQIGSGTVPASEAEVEAYPSPQSLHQETGSSRDIDGQPSDRNDLREVVSKDNEVHSPTTEEQPQEESKDEDISRAMADPYITDGSRTSDAEDFDLRPPAPKPKPPSTEVISELLFSPGHLNTLIYNPLLLTKFTAFLQKYRPQDYPILMRYLETSKAIKAVEYANAVAESAPALPHAVEGNATETSNTAAVLDSSFKETCAAAFDTLVNTSLPLFVTFSLVRVISDCLIDEILGRSNSFLRDVVGGLSEVFCLTDPNQKDNPIIYASEEFYRLTGYGQEDVIGYNCRFLQGPKTNKESPRRLKESLDRGEEIYETLLNYRKNGTPFINVLMIAPLHDDKGVVKYHLGAQIDASRLVESGNVMSSFQKYLTKRDSDKRREDKERARNRETEDSKKRDALNKLRELSELFDLEETSVVQSHSRAASLDRDADTRSIGSGTARRRLVDSDLSDSEEEQESSTEKTSWQLGQSGPLGLSGKLPGIYEKYMLIRPSPSLRVVFVSPKLRKFGGIVHSPFLSHVAAPAGTLSGLAESFKSGIPVVAKINFMSQRSEHRLGVRISPNERHEDGKYGSACWMSATPLIGGDDKIGVWMIVFVEKAQAKAQRARLRQSQGVGAQAGAEKLEQSIEVRESNGGPEQRVPGPPGTNQREEQGGKVYDLPIKPKRLDEAIHVPAQRRGNDRPTSAYRYQAATPVEEYHSADEDGEPGSPVISAPRADMPPQTPTYEIHDEDEYVQPMSLSSNGATAQRIHISPDSDHEQDDAEEHSDAEELDMSPYTARDEEIRDPNSIPPSVPSEQGEVSVEDEPEVNMSTRTGSDSPESEQNFGVTSVETIRKPRSPSGASFQSSREATLEKNSPPRSSTQSPRPGLPQRSSSHHTNQKATPTSTKSYQTHTARSSGTLPPGIGYMDYLRHPGSRLEPTRGRKKSRNGSDNDPFSGTECATSPYSVD